MNLNLNIAPIYCCRCGGADEEENWLYVRVIRKWDEKHDEEVLCLPCVIGEGLKMLQGRGVDVWDKGNWPVEGGVK